MFLTRKGDICIFYKRGSIKVRTVLYYTEKNPVFLTALHFPKESGLPEMYKSDSGSMEKFSKY